MDLLLAKLLEDILLNDTVEDKVELMRYINTTLKTRLYLFDMNDVIKLEDVLKDIDYNVEDFSKLLDCAYWIKNAVGKEGRYKSRTTVNQLLNVKDVFDELGITPSSYNTRQIFANRAISKCIYSIENDKGLINDEVNFLSIAKKNVDKYSSSENRNIYAIITLNILNRINKGFRELEEKYTGVVTSKEFQSMFEQADKLNSVYFSEIINEFYPLMKNQLFVYIKDFAQFSSEALTTEELVRHLRNIEHTNQMFDEQKSDIENKIKTIDNHLKKDLQETVSSLMDTIKNNDKINAEVKKRIMENINYIFNKYSKKQDEFLDTQMSIFIENCLQCVNDLSLNESIRNGQYSDLIKELLAASKDFFLEYDTKKLKEIFIFISENTGLTATDLKQVVNKCGRLFKDANVDKLKEIQRSLNKFKDYVNDRFEYAINDNLLEKILVNNPQMLLEENHVDEVLGLLNGTISFKTQGYTGDEITLKKDFFSHDFYKKIIDENCTLLFKGGLSNLNSNLNYLNEVCKNCDINIKYLNINEQFLYSLLNDSLYAYNSSAMESLSSILSSENLQIILERNPQILKLKQSALNTIVKRALLNCNSTYNFYDLLFSELYMYKNSSNPKKKSDERFRYYGLGIDTNSIDFDVEEILTSGLTEGLNASSLEKTYRQREKNVNKLNNAINSIKENEEDNSTLIKSILNSYRKLYGSVPDLEVKNKIFMILDKKKSIIEQQASDLEESLAEKDQIIKLHQLEIEDWQLLDKELGEIIDKVSTKKVKNDIKNIIKQNNDKKISENKKKLNEELNKVQEITKMIKELDKEAEHLNLALCQVDFLDDEDINREYLHAQSFCFNDLLNESKNDVDEVIDLKDNVVVFADNIDIDNKDFLNDKDCVDKLYKFLVDPKFSLKSIDYMSDSSQNADGIEKYRDQREKLWSRRESRTPVRVYYMPIHTKYFTIYYVVNVDKDTVHQNGGISDSVYKKHVSNCEKILNKLNKMDEQEAWDYAKCAEAEYKEKVKSLVKRKNKR